MAGRGKYRGSGFGSGGWRTRRGLAEIEVSSSLEDVNCFQLTRPNKDDPIPERWVSGCETHVDPWWRRMSQARAVWAISTLCLLKMEFRDLTIPNAIAASEQQAHAVTWRSTWCRPESRTSGGRGCLQRSGGSTKRRVAYRGAYRRSADYSDY